MERLRQGSAPTSRGRWRSRVEHGLVAIGVAAWIAVYLVVVAPEMAMAPDGVPVAAAPAASPAGPGAAAGAGSTGSESPDPVNGAATGGASVSPGPSAVASSDVPGAAASPGSRVLASPAPEAVAFGMSGHLMWHSVSTAIAQLDMLAHDGLDVVRFDVSWRGLEPRRGQFQWLDKLDRIVDAALARGIRPVVSVIETPGWANGDQSAWVPPDNPADYAAFIGKLAKRYAGRVDAWEVWNEPDIPLFWRPAPDAAGYARLLIAASAAIRAANPHATVVGGSVTFGNVDFVRQLYANGVRGTFDALSIHPYTLTRAPGDTRDRYHSLTAILDDMHAVMAAEGDGTTPIWITELGWAVVGVNSVSAAERPAYLAETVRIVRARPWVRVVTMYTISTADSLRYGLSTGGRRSAAWRAYVAAVDAAR